MPLAVVMHRVDVDAREALPLPKAPVGQPEGRASVVQRIEQRIPEPDRQRATRAEEERLRAAWPLLAWIHLLDAQSSMLISAVEKVDETAALPPARVTLQV